MRPAAAGTTPSRRPLISRARTCPCCMCPRAPWQRQQRAQAQAARKPSGMQLGHHGGMGPRSPVAPNPRERQACGAASVEPRLPHSRIGDSAARNPCCHGCLTPPRPGLPHLSAGTPRYLSDKKPPASTPYGRSLMPLAAQNWDMPAPAQTTTGAPRDCASGASIAAVSLRLQQTTSAQVASHLQHHW